MAMQNSKPYGTFQDNNRQQQDADQHEHSISVSFNFDAGDQQASSSCSSCKRAAKENLLLLLLLLGIGAGALLGFLLRGSVQPDDAGSIMYISFLGELLMRMLKLLILPLIVSSLVSAVAGLRADASSRLGVSALIFYSISTAVAMAIGMLLVYLLQPGAAAAAAAAADVVPAGTTQSSVETVPPPSAIDPLLDLIRNMFPENLIEACFKSTQTVMIPARGNVSGWQPSVQLTEGSTNVLGLVVYSLVLGCVLARLGEAGSALTQVMVSLQEATMQMVTMVIWFSPIGILSLVAGEIIRMPDPAQSMAQLGMYTATVLGGLALHSLLVLPLLYTAITRRSPLRLLIGCSPAMATAFGTSSSSATLPVTYNCLENSVGIDRRVTRFILPIGATVNMNGTALYEAVAPIFIAQLNGIELNFGQLIAISLTATCAAVGAAGIPQAGLVTMVIVLNAVGLPTTDVAKILAVDWLLDRFRTMVNVLGDCYAAGVVEHLNSRSLSSSSSSCSL